MTYQTNDFRDDLRTAEGFVDIDKLRLLRGESFDRHNDLWIDRDGARIYPRNGNPISIEKLGILGACTDALTAWERKVNGETRFRHARADDPSESGMLF